MIKQHLGQNKLETLRRFVPSGMDREGVQMNKGNLREIE